MMYRCGIAGSAVFPLVLSSSGGQGIRGTMHSVRLCNLRIVSLPLGILLFHALVSIFHILLSLCTRSLCALMLGN